MPAFRDRPWTWLFLLLTLGVNMQALIDDTDFTGDHDSVIFWQSAVILGQMIVVGAWSVLGSAQRLIRAIVFVGAFAGLAWLLEFAFSPRPFSTNRWNAYLSTAATTQLTVAIAAFATLMIKSWLSRPVQSQDSVREGPRFRVAEILAWMGIVALAIMLLREVPELIGDDPPGWRTLCTISGFCSAILVGPSRPSWGIGIPVAVAVTTLFFVSILAFAGSANEYYQLRLYSATIAYVACYLACRILDDRKRTTTAAADSD